MRIVSFGFIALLPLLNKVCIPGENLALVTRSHVGRHILRLYDVRRKRRTASDMTSLEAFHFDYDEHWDSEVTCASYSPDGRLLALARNDDRLHVYDTRYLNKRPLLRFFHWGEHRDDAVCGRDNDTQKLKRYGVTQMSWVQGWRGRGLGLVSGGGDGCVRLWDALGSDDDPLNGEVLAQTDWSIGSFSLGDSYNGEKPLVVGDNGARAYIYDRTSRIEDISP
ncbi:hypothetical protein OF83DRAFT_1048744 [Amylostereum chailletii]|nr:hypothetical protein OF83DRAFT_1048744 [Amylostereum chailletii]